MTTSAHLQVIRIPKQETRFSTVTEVARVMRVSNMTVYRLINAGTLPAYTFGRSMRIPTAAVWNYIRGQKVDPDDLSKTKAL